VNPVSRTWRQRVLVAALTRRELVARYRGGAIGFLWSLLNPLLLLAVYATVFRVVFAPRSDVRPYALFLFGGVLVWSFVSSGLLDAAWTFRAHGPLLRKTTVFPEVFPAVAVAARLSHLLLGLPVLAAAIAFAAWRGSVKPGPAVLEFPLVLLLLAVTVWGFALAISSLAVHFGDIRDLLANLLTLAFFLTPILYPLESVPEKYRTLLHFNPFAPFFAAMHETLFFFRPVSVFEWIWMLAITAAAVLLGGAVFSRLRDSIAEEA
jgi:lipopolysaccharide transport system permease protein